MVTIKDFADACRAEGLLSGAENDEDERLLACSTDIRETRRENNLVRAFWNVHRNIKDARWSIIAAVSMLIDWFFQPDRFSWLIAWLVKIETCPGMLSRRVFDFIHENVWSFSIQT